METKNDKLQKICNEKYGDLYDLSESIVKGERDEFIAKCKNHGDFETTPRAIINSKTFICEKCNEDNIRGIFFNKMKENFGDMYDFSKFGFPNKEEKGIVICKKHGEFAATRNSLYQNHGCPKCANEKLMNKAANNRTSFNDAMKMIKAKIGDEKFDNFEFDESTYCGTTKKMRIYCKKHQELFNQTPNRISQGRGCEKCSYENKYGSLKTYQKSFEELAREVHGNEYDYLGYDENEGKYIMYCHTKDENGIEHGEFKQTRGHHLNGQGCPICRYIKSGMKKRNSLDRLKLDIEKFKSDKNYTWDFDSYIAYDKQMRIYCHEMDKDGNEHGWFINTPNNLFMVSKPNNCPKCGRERTNEAKRVKPEEFYERAKLLHRGKYTYGEYNGYYEDMQMFCPIHGEFWMTPANHLQNQGCPFCKESKLEIDIRNFLDDNNIKYIAQYSSYWLGKQSLDFYLPDYFIGIECQGKQHFNMGGWNEPFEVIKERDERKLKLCNEHNIKLLYYSNLGIEYPYKVFEDKNELLNEINNIIKNS